MPSSALLTSMDDSTFDDGGAIKTRGYQQEMLDESLRRNIIIAMDTGSGKTHIAVLRLKHETERGSKKLSWFLAPTVALCKQQCSVIQGALPVSVGLISGALAPDQWKDASLWKNVLSTHQVMVSTPQVLLDALRHGYILMGADIGLIIFDEAHHAVDNDPYNRIMQEFYQPLPTRDPTLATIASSQRRMERPMIMGLTASPIFGGNVDKAFQMIEANLDSIIVSPLHARSELSKYVHRPTFKHILYHPPDHINPPFSTNLAALERVQTGLNIENDPYIQSLRNQLSQKAPGTPEYYRLDQRLSKTVATEGTFTHKGLRDFVRTASEILNDVGVWATDWYIWQVIENAKKAATGSSDFSSLSWQSQEKAYLLGIINQIGITPASYHPDDIVDEQSDKVTALLQCLLNEKEEAETANETFSGLVFVQRRDVVLALAELLKHHPVTKGEFQLGPLLGASDSSHRHAFLDITRKFIKQSQDDMLTDFKLGDKNLIISTSVAEEGIDVQACGCVIRWDRPMNMASWAQSRGRARKKRSTFVMMFEDGNTDYGDVLKWERLEAEMVARYVDPSRALDMQLGDEDGGGGGADEMDDTPPFRVDSTGAALTLQSSIPHLNHFCAVMPHRGHFVYQPLYDLDPPDYPIGWHSFSNRSSNPYTGPWSSTVTLPRVLPQDLRVFRTPRIYPTKVSAHRHAAFETYKALYDAGLVNENLLPLFDEGDPEVEELKKEIEKRTGMASVSGQMDPWIPNSSLSPGNTIEGGMETGLDSDAGMWFISNLTIGDLPMIQLLTRRRVPLITALDELKLYHPLLDVLQVHIEPMGEMHFSDERFAQAQVYTRRLLWSINGSRMKWGDLDFAYLFLRPGTGQTSLHPDDDSEWESRRSWWMEKQMELSDPSPDRESRFDLNKVPALEFGEAFSYPDDIGMVYGSRSFKAYDFVRWRRDPLSEEEEGKIRERYSILDDVQIPYPILEVRPFHPRTNFLLPRPSGPAPLPPPSLFLLPQNSDIALISKTETHYAFLIPSILRAIALNLTVDSLRSNLFTDQSVLSMIPNSLLVVALSAPVSQEPKNYQRLETLGDTVLKFVVAIQLLAQYPLWPEGYLTKRKDHAVSNVRLAKENVSRGLYRWIIRDRLVGKKWKPLYISAAVAALKEGHSDPVTATEIDASSSSLNTQGDILMAERSSENDQSEATMAVDQSKECEGKKNLKKKQKKKKDAQQLSTKVLADVVESLIGAAYVHGGFSFGYECTKFFHLNIESWLPLPTRISQVLSRSDESYASILSTSISSDQVQFPTQIASVEKLIGYTFCRPLLLLEALTHASCQDDHGTISYERMEFLGDAVLDMVVTDFLYHAQGRDGSPKEYSPGHIFLRKSAMVNAHILAFVCLKSKVEVRAKMPKAYGTNEEDEGGEKRKYRGEQKIVLEEEEHTIHLFKCLLHSSPKILEEQNLTHARFIKRETELTRALEEGRMFPWATLTRLQAPKFFSDMIESILGAVYLDSEGKLETVIDVMRSLGLYQILEKIVKEDMDVLHPVSRLAMWAGKQVPEAKQISYDYKKEKGRISCGVLIDGIELEGSRVDDIERGRASQEEVRLAAADEAIKALKLKNVGADYDSLKKKKNKANGKRKEI